MAYSFSSHFAAAAHFYLLVPLRVRFFLPLVLMLSSRCLTISSSHTFSGSEEPRDERSYLFQEILRDEAVSRLNDLGKASSRNCKVIMKHKNQDYVLQILFYE
ncbi:hypothetical protein Dimus_032376 [Dionaea muscipula]